MLLEVKNLETEFRVKRGQVKAVNGVSFEVEKGEILAVVGESGSGKSVTSLSIMGLIRDPGKIVGGQILFNGEDLLKKSTKEMEQIRGDRISMIFQEPMTSLNPVYRIKDQIMENILTHEKVSKEEALKRSIEMLDLVSIPAPERRAYDYPHQMSGGMRQRVMIAMALLCDPKLLIADEPTTALDVTIQAQILRIIKKLTKEMDTAVILITHDMGVVAEVADNVMVMYAGKSVEYGTAEDIFDHPEHPYTVGLLNSIPKLGSGQEDHLYTIDGTVPGLDEMPAGCRFCTRCQHVMEKCKREDPGMREVNGHMVRCFLYGEGNDSNGKDGEN